MAIWGAALFVGGAALFDSPRGSTPPCRGPDYMHSMACLRWAASDRRTALIDAKETFTNKSL